MLVYSCYFQLTSCARLDVFSHMHHAVWIEIESYNRIVALRHFRFFFYAQAVAVFIKLCHTISFRIVDIIAKYACQSFFCSFYAFLE
ncbi:Uncharacterised protein [Segatella copri]|nr:Uncharacterised protein [Segatella copri]